MARTGLIAQGSIALALSALVVAAPAQAASDCPSALICATNPQGVVASLQAQGYKAVLGRSDNTGNPKITSAAAGYDYTLFFYGCENGANCTSLGFSITFADDGGNSLELANLWNKDKRFSAMSYDESDKTLMLTYDVSTIGGLNQVNFADVVDWWQTMLGQANTFFKEHPAPKK